MDFRTTLDTDYLAILPYSKASQYPSGKKEIIFREKAKVLYHLPTWQWVSRFSLDGRRAMSGPEKREAHWGFVGFNAKNPDVRLMPMEAKQELAAIEEEIAALQEKRQAYIWDHFRQWPLVSKDDVRQVPGDTKQDCVEKFRGGSK